MPGDGSTARLRCDHGCARRAGVRSGLGLAGAGSGSAALPARRRSVCGGPAPRDRHRRSSRHARARPGGRGRLLRRHRPGGGPNGLAPDGGRLLGHARCISARSSCGAERLCAEGGLVGTVGPSGVVELPVPYVYLGVRRASEPNGYLDPLLLLPGAEVPPVGPPATGDEPSLVVARAPAVVSAGPAAVVPAPGAEPLEVKTGLAPAFAAPRATAAPTVARPVPVEAEQSREHGERASASVSTPGERAVPVRPRERRPAARSTRTGSTATARSAHAHEPSAVRGKRGEGWLDLATRRRRGGPERRHELGLPGQADLRGVRVRGARARPLPALTRAAPGCDRRSGEPEAGSYH